MRIFVVILAGAVWLLSAQGNVWAQAYLGDPNSLAVGFGYTYAPAGKIITTSHGDDPGLDYVPDVKTFAHTFDLGVRYNTPVNGLRVEAGVPLVGVKLGDDVPWRHFPAPGPYDDGSLHWTVTDVRGGLRYQVKPIEEQIGLTFSVLGSMPTHDYPTDGFTFPDQHLRALYLGVGVGRSIDPISPNLIVEAEYQYVLREKVDVTEATEQFGRNYSSASLSFGYAIGDFGIAASGDFRLAHGGVTFAELIDYGPDVQAAHDRLLKEDIGLVGGDIAYAVTDSFAISAGARFFVWGNNTRNQNLFALGGEYTFF